MQPQIKKTMTHIDYKNDNTILSFYNCGIHECEPGHQRSGVKDHYLIHYVLSGKGTYTINHTDYEIFPKMGFLTPPNTPFTYIADKEDPWYYCWFGFSGSNAKEYMHYLRLSHIQPIFQCSKDVQILENIKEILSKGNSVYTNPFFTKGTIYHLLSIIYESTNANYDIPIHDAPINIQKLYIEKAIEYINKNYSNKLSINDISNYIGINRRYLYYIFKNHLHISPQQFLQDYRMNKACSLLANHQLDIYDVAQSVGYDNSSVFSKIFKKKIGYSPSHYRKLL